jgi:hypothetical protein
VPDDPGAAVALLDAIRPGRGAAAELGAPAGSVGDVTLGHRDLVDALALTERDVAVAAAEVAVEGEGDVLRDDETAVARDLDNDVRPREGERLGVCVPGERERRQQRDG